MWIYRNHKCVSHSAKGDKVVFLNCFSSVTNHFLTKGFWHPDKSYALLKFALGFVIKADKILVCNPVPVPQ